MKPRRPTTSSVPSARRNTREDPGVDSAFHHRLSTQMFRADSPAGSSSANGAPGINLTSYTLPAKYGTRIVSRTTIFWGRAMALSPRANGAKVVTAMNDMKLRSISDLLSPLYPLELDVGSALSAHFHQHSTCQPSGHANPAVAQNGLAGGYRQSMITC